MVLLQRDLLGKKYTDSNPTDRAKSGTKHSILVDGNGMPLSVVVNDAAKRDMT
jgi:putative transposase